jgi:two-component system, NarL family, sensor histidine kinase UhpB
MGVCGMHERVAQVDGTLEIESSPGSGTTIFVRIPLDEQERRPDRMPLDMCTV